MTIEQQKTIEKITEEAKNDKNILGVILCGSLAKNKGNEKSDVDVYVIVTDDVFDNSRKQKNISGEQIMGHHGMA